jgi:hypothetical protein
MAVGLNTKAGWASWAGLAHVGMRQLQAGLRGKMEDLAQVHWCVNSKDAGPCDQHRLVVTLEHHAGGVVSVNTAGQKVEGARRGSAW